MTQETTQDKKRAAILVKTVCSMTSGSCSSRLAQVSRVKSVSLHKSWKYSKTGCHLRTRIHKQVQCTPTRLTCAMMNSIHTHHRVKTRCFKVPDFKVVDARHLILSRVLTKISDRYYRCLKCNWKVLNRGCLINWKGCLVLMILSRNERLNENTTNQQSWIIHWLIRNVVSDEDENRQLVHTT